MAARLQDLLTAAVHRLPAIKDSSFGAHFDTFGNFKVTLLGDASHGTSEFYLARAEITKRLIERHGVTVVAIEGDWPDSEVVDRYVRQRPGPKAPIGEEFEPFKRFPTWMWRNREMQELVEWMRNRNADLPMEKRAGFFGLDLYSMGTSIRAVINFLDRVDPEAATVAKERYGCLQPWVEDPSSYGLASTLGMQDCECEVVSMLRDLLKNRLGYSEKLQDCEEFLSVEQNAYLIKDAERYYKAMYYNSAESWTLRDTHMVDTLKRLLRARAPNTKAVVWAHNSHCGDARYTSMGIHRGEKNVGQLCREDFSRERVALVGCGTHTGTVAAAHNWGGDLEIMKVNPSRQDSWEILAHNTGVPSFLLDLRKDKINPSLLSAMAAETKRLERFIGVIYRPDTERLSHYSQAFLQEQFDIYVWFDETEAVHALEKIQPATPVGLDETYPFGL